MIKNLQKTVAEKDNEINDLKTRLEALVTAITWDSNAQANKGVTDALEGMSYDTLEVAHRIVSRLRTLKEENDSLGVSFYGYSMRNETLTTASSIAGPCCPDGE